MELLPAWEWRSTLDLKSNALERFGEQEGVLPSHIPSNKRRPRTTRCWLVCPKSNGCSRDGEVREGFIKTLRTDHKLNIALHAPGYAKVDAIAQGVLDVLTRRGGFMPVTDKSKPEDIYALFGISKKAFKLTVGALYKSRRILIEEGGIRLVTGP